MRWAAIYLAIVALCGLWTHVISAVSGLPFGEAAGILAICMIAYQESGGVK